MEFHASNDMEKEHIQQQLGTNNIIHIISDIPDEPEFFERQESHSDRLKIIFISRISPKKNLLYALSVLKDVSCEYTFDIYGPIEDKEYWQECLNFIDINKLDGNVTYKGTISPEKVHELFLSYELFLFPTFGENFGHVIYEALVSGCLPLISDQTPWEDMENYDAGWAVPLKNTSRYIEIIENVSSMASQNRLLMAKNSQKYAAMKYDGEQSFQAHKKMFDSDGE